MTKSILARRVATAKPPMTRQMTTLGNELARQGRSIMSLSQGEPDFDTPKHVRDAGHAAIDAGITRYTDIPGTRELTQAIIRKFKRDNGLTFEANQVTIGVGSKQVLYNALQATVDPGDEVVIAVPAWVSYPEMVKLAEGVPVILPAHMDQGFKVTAEQIGRAITPKTKWVMLNSPSNPSGAVYSAEELKAIAAVLAKHPHVWFMSDDIYEKLLYTGKPFPTMAAIVPEMASRCLTINGLSKAFAMTGWRVGYAGGPADLIKGINLVQGQSVSHTSSISQAAAVAALDGPMDFLPPFLEAYKRRRDLVVKAMNEIPGVKCMKPDGAFYVFPNVDALLGKKTPAGKTIATDLDLCMYFLEDAGVAVVPGAAFELPGHFRISYAASDEQLTEGMKRLQDACSRLA